MEKLYILYCEKSYLHNYTTLTCLLEIWLIMFYGKDFINCVDGGFDNNELEYEETHKIVILPSCLKSSFSICGVRLAVDAILMAEGAERKEHMGIKGLTKLLADNAPKAMKEQKLESYFGRKIAM
ncbi:hypothetical protein E1A91_D06G182600v1 [Gossypium mustelinum]|uniref:Uncharacterized protein n=3 Tax=Gossypium TaxID=3633 RepID=A0A5D2UKK2_GOSMU|nr:hypothetical protein ES319_D06G181800v1 [Gossypium barbadense]TYG65534.1 hypothetical protein ES288_D06G193700v1 [Gossypium darwinii]TYI56190.1 hypothetical protein E1A91_D11G192200v1 [Gossypium mustelinum]TYI78029.1 hypothetical protein E1A91_D06G182600v1 [Gossypium mustelinum]